MATLAVTPRTETRSAETRPRLRLVSARQAAAAGSEAAARYGEGGRNWPLIGLIAAVHLALIATLLSSGVVKIGRSEPKPVYARFLEQPDAAPPAEPVEVPLQPVKTEIVVPEVEIETPASVVPALTATKVAPPVPAVAAPAKSVEAAPIAAPITPPDFSAEQLDNPGPRYPALSRRGREQGTVMLKVLVSPDGRAQELGIETSSGFKRLDEAALDTVRRWQFLPAKQAGRAVAAWVLVPVTFALS